MSFVTISFTCLIALPLRFIAVTAYYVALCIHCNFPAAFDIMEVDCKTVCELACSCCSLVLVS